MYTTGVITPTYSTVPSIHFLMPHCRFVLYTYPRTFRFSLTSMPIIRWVHFCVVSALFSLDLCRKTYAYCTSFSKFNNMYLDFIQLNSNTLNTKLSFYSWQENGKTAAVLNIIIILYLVCCVAAWVSGVLLKPTTYTLHSIIKVCSK